MLRLGFICSIAVSLSFGCNTVSYDQQVAAARREYGQGNFSASTESLSKILALKNESHNHPAAHLERGLSRLAAGEHETSSKDFEAADEIIDIIDYSADPAVLTKWIISGNQGNYRAPPYERVFLATLNLLNHAARSEVSDARTWGDLAYANMEGWSQLERDYSFESPLAYGLLGLMEELDGNSGDPRKAAAALEKANSLLGSAGGKRVFQAMKPGAGEGGLVTIVLNGKAPIWRQRSPSLKSVDDAQVEKSMDAAINAVLAHSANKGSKQRSRAQLRAQIEEEQQLKMAVLTKRASPHSSADLRVAGQTGQMSRVLDLENQIIKWHERVRGELLTQAMIRVLTRTGAEVGIRELSNDRGDAWIGDALATVTGEALKAADVPDTRCWSLLPKEVLYYRSSLPVGEQEVTVALKGSATKSLSKRVTIEAGKTSFVVFVAH